MKRAAIACAGVLVTMTTAARATPEPWSDSDPPAPMARVAVGEGGAGVRAGAEGRANALHVTPISTASHDRHLAVFEHRLRLDGALDWQERVGLVTSLDVLDGVAWGDNGGPDGRATTTSGANLLTRDTNATRACLVARDGLDPTTPDAYALVPCDVAPVFVRRLYGEVRLPFGRLRVGRQAYDDGTGVLVSDGDGRRNRFGFARRGDNVDRVLFATKPFEAFAAPDERDGADDRGAFLFLAYDRVASGAPQRLADDAHEWVTALRFLAPSLRVLRDVDARLFHAYRWQSSTDTSLHAVGARLAYRFGHVSTGFDAAVVAGATRALPLVVGDAERREVRTVGARASVAWDVLPWLTPYLELDYASGESSPSAGAPVTRFAFSTDANVGLLLFEHVLAYQSARAAAAGAAIARARGGDDAAARAASQVATGGAFTNAIALFPQIDMRPADDLLVRVGVMFAQAQSVVVDPVRSLERRARGLSDVNLAGGAPARGLGTELDARVQYRVDPFAFDLEGALLFPGDALADADGEVPRAAMVQARTTIAF